MMMPFKLNLTPRSMVTVFLQDDTEIYGMLLNGPHMNEDQSLKLECQDVMDDGEESEIYFVEIPYSNINYVQSNGKPLP